MRPDTLSRNSLSLSLSKKRKKKKRGSGEGRKISKAPSKKGSEGKGGKGGELVTDHGTLDLVPVCIVSKR